MQKTPRIAGDSKRLCEITWTIALSVCGAISFWFELKAEKGGASFKEDCEEIEGESKMHRQESICKQQPLEPQSKGIA